MKYSCYYIIHLGCLWALLCTFILFLGLTYWPRAQCQFLFFPLFQCFAEKEYQTESKRNETFGSVIFGTNVIEETWSWSQGSFEVATRQGGAPYPPGRAPHPRGPVVAPLTDFFRLYMSIYPKNIGEQNRSGVPPPEASVTTKNQSRPVLAPCRRGDPSPVAIFIIPALSMTRRE